MKTTLAIEWFLNPDHLPFIVGLREGIFKKNGIGLEIIEPTEHYDGLEELRKGNITFATNEPLHLIEQFDEEFLTMGTYFETKGGVLLKKSSYDKLKNGERITVTSPVSNEKTNTIAFEIIRRFYAKEGVEVKRDQVEFVANGFEHLKYMKEGADAGWLYFYNFEGVEAQHEGMEVLYLDAANVGFANFSALDIFVNKSWYKANTQACETFVNAVKEAIAWMQEHPAEAMAHYYGYTQAEKSGLTDDILRATLECFRHDFRSLASEQEPILDFFTEIGITKLPYDDFKKPSWPKMKGLLFVAHGSRREASNREFTQMVSQLRGRLALTYDKVEASFLEFAMPGIDEALHAMIHKGMTEIQVYPFFLNSGKHVHHDIPEKIRETKQMHPEVNIVLLPHFGSSKHILSVISNDLKEL